MMKVFVTGATGFIGSAIVQELIAAGHQVTGLAHSDANVASLTAAGAEAHRGDLHDLDSLKAGAAAADGVIHAGFIHDFTRFAEVCEIDRLAIEAMGEVLAGSDRPFIVTSGVAIVSPGKLATEDIIPEAGAFPRKSEEAADALAAKGVRVSVVRLSPSVHGNGDRIGFVPTLINIAREKGVSAYIAEGSNRWNAVHKLDAALLYKLALETRAAPGTRFHAVDEESISFKAIADLIGKKLNLPVISISKEEAPAHFGWFAGFAGIDCPASGKITQERLSWHPTHVELLKDMEHGTYFHS